MDYRWVMLLFALGYLPCLVSAIYTPIREYAGSTFFDRWEYYGNVDNTTWGNVTYLDRPSANVKSLTYVNGVGNAIVKVDDTTNLLPGPLVVNRDSIRLTSTDSYGVGSLIIVDAVHVPFGCSVWPAFWTLGTGKEWPEAGEIDIIEAINGMNHNQIALHTTPGCFQAQPPGQSGTTLEGDCSTNRGCIVAETKPNSYGAGFAQAGGGVYAVQIAVSGIYVWFFSRPDVPENVKTATSVSQIDTVSWGIPTASYPASACDIEKFFPPQQLILLTTLCGVWAGVPDIYRSTCQTPTGSCFADNVLGPGDKFVNAYWEIRYIRTYLSDDAPPLPPTTSLPPSTTPSLPTTASPVQTPTPTPPPSSSVSLRSSTTLLSYFVLGVVITMNL